MEQSFRTICSYCHTSCGLVVTVRDGRITKVKGDPDHPASKGYHCRKANAAVSLVYHPDRVQTPLLKTKGGFKKVSWDEALTFAADKLASLKDRYGAQTLVRAVGAPFTFECRDGFVQFMALYGSRITTGVRHLCGGPRQLGINAVLGDRVEPDYKGTKLAILWGANVIGASRYSTHAALADFSRTIARVKKGGGKVVVIDPVKSESVRFCDEWIPLRLGSDLALALAMIQVIIQDELYDREFVRNYTLGFDLLKGHVSGYTPEWAAKHTGLSPERIRNFAREYAETKPAVIYDGNGLDMHTQGVEACRAIAMLLALTGNVDRPGSDVMLPWSKQAVVPTVQAAKDPGEKRPYPLFIDYPYQVVLDSLLSDREDRARAMIVNNSNPALVLANSERTRRAMERLELLIVYDHFMTATATMADLVLPDAAGFERNGYRAFSSAEGCFFAFRRKLIEPPGECRPIFEVEYGLAEKMGMGKDYPFRNNEEWIDFKVKPSGISIRDLQEKQIVYTTPPVRYEKFKTEKLGTPSGKVEFFSERFQKAGYDPMPTFRERREDPEIKKRFPLEGTSRKPGIYSHTQFRNSPELSKRQPMPFAWINPLDASARGIENGSLVEVESPHGRIQLEARTEEKGPQGVVVVDFGWGNPWDGGANINWLTDDQDRDPISNGTSNRLFPCEVRKVEPSLMPKKQ